MPALYGTWSDYSTTVNARAHLNAMRSALPPRTIYAFYYSWRDFAGRFRLAVFIPPVLLRRGKARR